MQKARKKLSSYSSISSLSDIALRSRTVSRDSILCYSEDNELSDSLSNVLQKNKQQSLSLRKKKKGSEKDYLRKFRKIKRDISKKPKWKLQETIVLAPFHALKECFQNQLREICGQKNLTSRSRNKKNNNVVNNIVEVESLVPILKQDLHPSDQNNLKRKRCSTTVDDSDYCDCFDDNVVNLTESCESIPNKNSVENDSRSDFDGSSVIFEKERLNKKSKKCNTKTSSGIRDELICPQTSTTKKLKPSCSQKKRNIKSNSLNAGRNPKLPSRTKNKTRKVSSGKKNSCNTKIWKKAPTRISRPRYRTRSVTKRETEKKERLLKLVQAQNEIVTKFEKLRTPNLPNDKPCQKNICNIQADDVPIKDQNPSTNTKVTQETSDEPPCVVLHPFDPKRKRNGNLSGYSSDESIQETPRDESEKKNHSPISDSGIQGEKNSSEEQGTSNLQAEKNQEQGSLKKTLQDARQNSKEKFLSPNVQTFLTLGMENANEITNNTGELASKAEGIANQDLSLNSDDIAAETVEPKITVQEHYDEPSSVESSLSYEHEEDEIMSHDLSNQMELPTFCCPMEEADQQTENSTSGYIFGPRDDFSRQRESCEFSFGLSRAIPDDQEPDAGELFDISRN